MIDPDGQPMDGRAILPGPIAYPLVSPPPSPASRRGLGARLQTGLAVFDTLLPIVQGQRVGLFAGSGVGKSRLTATLATRMTADVVVIGLIGERGREVRDFVTETLGPDGLKRAVVVAATSDRPALTRARAAHAMMAVADSSTQRSALDWMRTISALAMPQVGRILTMTAISISTSLMILELTTCTAMKPRTMGSFTSAT